ncbi:hypothetical protein CBI38_31195 (plasmid) [Rhodococcus oxybenzonivorans]|uniref:Swt1-like HEPN domain-containing protein n=1 Tax=Rhodococcus oxybenzonivorans TaxID=1990687 RepID=A0A2S2C5C4_9NOCA|nr:hypothetical protein [Rhodococcus oxybenzonivorans]AWK76042.1 hypothetical protein CBI38_31195 [Rhodococcus oxybenzonivorans]
MDVVNPYEAVRLVELDLRQLVRVVLGSSWLEAAREGGVVDEAKLAAKMADERGRRPATVVSTDLIDYTDFTQLQVLILEKRWGAFAPALGTKKHIETYLSKIAGFRNPTMHARVLHPFEEHLVLGISGELRNRIAIYRNTKEQSSMYYPVVDSITDNFGNIHDGVTNAITQTGVRMEIGETVTFTCRATDPEDRELHWQLSNNAAGQDSQTDEATGNEVVLSYTFARADVSERVPLLITLRSSGEFHRLPGPSAWDATAMFHYAVNPPSDHR